MTQFCGGRFSNVSENLVVSIFEAKSDRFSEKSQNDHTTHKHINNEIVYIKILKHINKDDSFL
jgi:hypothetical protein